MMREPRHAEQAERSGWRSAHPIHAPELTHLTMRLLGLLFLILASSIAPQAQERFVQACLQSSEADDLDGVDPSVLCQCTADTAMKKGISGASLDGMTMYVDEAGNLDFGEAPAPVQAAAEIVVGGIFTCLFESLGGAMGEAMSEMGAAFSELGEATSPPATSEAEVSPSPVSPRSAPRTNRRVSQTGRGAAVRIRG